MDINKAIENGIFKIKPFFIKHKIGVFAVVLFFILMIAGNSMSSSAKAMTSSADRLLADIQNQIAQLDSLKHQVTQVIKHLDHGLDAERWQNDDTIAAQWILPAFNFSNADEYMTNRDLYINRLSPDDPFVTTLLAPYVAVFQPQSSESLPDDGKAISCKVNSFKSYVAAIDEENGIYSYVSVLTCASNIPQKYNYQGQLKSTDRGFDMDNTIALMYDINKKGELYNFNAIVIS